MSTCSSHLARPVKRRAPGIWSGLADGQGRQGRGGKFLLDRSPQVQLWAAHLAHLTSLHPVVFVVRLLLAGWNGSPTGGFPRSARLSLGRSRPGRGVGVGLGRSGGNEPASPGPGRSTCAALLTPPPAMLLFARRTELKRIIAPVEIRSAWTFCPSVRIFGLLVIERAVQLIDNDSMWPT